MKLKTYKYSAAQGLQKIKTKTAVALSIVTLAIGGGAGMSAVMFGAAHAATPDVVFTNLPDPQPANVSSLGFEATSTSEVGEQLGLAGSSRENPDVTVLMSSWACQSGDWTSGCTTAPGATFNHDITLNLYQVGANDEPGSLIATQTENFSMPYRPSSDGCGGDATAYTAPDDSCNHGIAFPITFHFSGLTLPDDVIVGVAFNTSNYGASPLNVTGPYDSLNVGLVGSPSVGTTLPSDQDAYLNSSWSGAYCDGDQGTGTFRLDEGCWGGYLPAIEVTASAPMVPAASANDCKNGGWQNVTDSNGGSFKNQGDCVSWVQHNVNMHGTPANGKH